MPPVVVRFQVSVVAVRVTKTFWWVATAEESIESARPFALAVSTAEPAEQVLVYLHEPGGQPYREDNGIGAGSGESAGQIVVDARDVVPGFYEAAIVAPPLDGARATLVVRQSPLTLHAGREGPGIRIRLGNLSPDAVATEPFVVLVGAERTTRVEAGGSAVERVRFQVPDWVVHASVDVSLDRGAWTQFTDLGMTMLDDQGRQLGKSPLNYAFGRLHVDLTDRTGGPREAELALFPGFADPAGARPWSATVSIRLYADSAHVTRTRAEAVTVPAGGSATVSVPFPESRLLLGTAFVPLGIVVVPEDDQTWTLEVPLPAPGAPLNP